MMFGIPRSTFFIIGIVAGILLLIVLLIIVSMWARHRHELARFEKEHAEALRNAEREVQQMQQSKATTQHRYPVTELPCPNCGRLVQTTEAFCPHCRYLLSASASGLHLHATPPPPVALQPQANYIQPRGEQKAPTVDPQSSPNQLCPNCGHEVRPGATYCSNCRYQLSAISRGAPPTINTSSAPELSIVDKSLAPSNTTSQPEQAPVKETELDDLVIQATLKRLWDKASR